MPDPTETKATLATNLERLRDAVGPYLDPTNLTPERAKKRKNVVFGTAFAVLILSGTINVISTNAKHGKCGSPAPGIAYLKIQSAASYDQKRGTNAAREFMQSHPSATEVDVCAEDVGTIIERFHPVKRQTEETH